MGKKEKKGKKKDSKESAPQKNNKKYLGIPARERHPDRVMRRMIQSSGPEMAIAHAEHYGLQEELKKPYFIEAVARYNRRKEDRRSGLQTQTAPETPPQAE